jgi:fluoride exporter
VEAIFCGGCHLNRFLLIAIGAVVGANARYWVGVWAGGRFGADFPYGTFIVNVTGSLVIGFLLSLSTERLSLSPEMRLLLVTGFLGSYTTFSSYTFESMTLIRDGGMVNALINIFGNNLVGLTCALVGTYLARWVAS